MCVTPCVGVWIETLLFKRIAIDVGVTPCVGVWIETLVNIIFLPFELSHPAWVCGLKLCPGKMIT